MDQNTLIANKEVTIKSFYPCSSNPNTRNFKRKILRHYYIVQHNYVVQHRNKRYPLPTERQIKSLAQAPSLDPFRLLHFSST